jgi:hypothetical protein
MVFTNDDFDSLRQEWMVKWPRITGIAWGTDYVFGGMCIRVYMQGEPILDLPGDVQGLRVYVLPHVGKYSHTLIHDYTL